MNHRQGPRMVVRYRDGTRLNHWLVAILFFAAGLSGLVIFHPFFFPLSGLFGGGVWTRILHPFLGLAMVLGFAFLFFQVRKENRWDATDRAWVRNAGRMVRGDEEGMPPVGKYNAGQKGVFWVSTLCLLVLLATGFVFWQPWFAPAFPVVALRVAVLLHAIAATVLILAIIVHIYAAIWVKGSIPAMTRGTVSEGWAKFHHPLWWRQVRDR